MMITNIPNENFFFQVRIHIDKSCHIIKIDLLIFYVQFKL